MLRILVLIARFGSELSLDSTCDQTKLNLHSLVLAVRDLFLKLLTQKKRKKLRMADLRSRKRKILIRHLYFIKDNYSEKDSFIRLFL